MRKNSCTMRGVIAIAVLLLGVTVGPVSAVGIGDAAPGFTLTDTDGSSHSLSAYQQHPVLIMFLVYNDPTCLSLAPRVQEDFELPYSPALVVLGIETSGCSSEGLNAFHDATGVDFPLLLNGGSTLSAYGLPAGSFVLVDANGIVKYIAQGGAYNAAVMKSAVEQALSDAADVKARTWGQIKNLYK